jgi:hypothetical protein
MQLMGEGHPDLQAAGGRGLGREEQRGARGHLCQGGLWGGGRAGALTCSAACGRQAGMPALDTRRACSPRHQAGMQPQTPGAAHVRATGCRARRRCGCPRLHLLCRAAGLQALRGAGGRLGGRGLRERTAARSRGMEVLLAVAGLRGGRDGRRRGTRQGDFGQTAEHGRRCSCVCSLRRWIRAGVGSAGRGRAAPGALLRVSRAAPPPPRPPGRPAPPRAAPRQRRRPGPPPLLLRPAPHPEPRSQCPPPARRRPPPPPRHGHTAPPPPPPRAPRQTRARVTAA